MTSRKTPTRSHLFAGLIIPLVVGLGLYLLLDLLIDRQVIENELLLRYLTGHPISRITTFMFCVGIAALVLIANNVFDQFCVCRRITLPENEEIDNEAASQMPQRVDDLMDHLESHRRSWHSHYLWQRLRGVLQFVDRTGGTAGLEEELKYLSDLDHEWQQRRYSLVRIVIWATPMLGFLGTVLGISQALGGIQVGPDNDFQQMLNSLRGSLFVAFDTTALALTLSILLMFLQFLVDRVEVKLLEVVNQQAHQQLASWYRPGTFLDPQTRAVERIGRKVMESSRELVRQQTEIWRESMHRAEASWTQTASQLNEQLQSDFTTSVQQVAKELTEALTEGVERSDQAMANRWEQWQVTLSQYARQLNAQQQQMLAQTELIQKVLTRIETVGDVQQALNRNLDALAATSRLHHTLDQLSESILALRRDEQSGNPESRADVKRVGDEHKTSVRIEPRFEPAFPAARKAA